MSAEESIEGKASPDLFFTKEVDLFKVEGELSKKHLLPPLGAIFGEECFAKVYMGWKIDSLLFRFVIEKEGQVSVFYPDFRQGDSIELFIDTRQIAEAKTTHRFYHQFYFLPESFEGHIKGECTRFRTEDSHTLCPDEALEYTVKQGQNGYTATIEIPKECLVGYDPQESKSIGFTYRVNRADGASQHFAMALEHSRIDAMPSLFAHLRLTQ